MSYSKISYSGLKYLIPEVIADAIFKTDIKLTEEQNENSDLYQFCG